VRHDISGESEICDRFEATSRDGELGDDRDPAARSLRSNSSPTASLQLRHRIGASRVHLLLRRCMSSSRSFAVRCASEPTLMIWERTRGSSRLVNANGPSRLVPSSSRIRRRVGTAVGNGARIVDKDVDVTLDQAGESAHRARSARSA